MIEVRNLHKTYRMGDTVVRALNGVSLVVDDGDFVAIMGPSGSGKSTLTHILGLLDIPNEGSYKLNGIETSSLSEDDLAILRRDEIGFIFQQFNLLPRMNAEENVELPLLYSRRQGPPSPEQLLQMVGLKERLHHRPNELSGGQQQRVAIARSLVNQPRIVIADEPTGNLDSASEKDIMAELIRLNSTGITVIIVTHEESVGRQAKRLIRMRDGVIQSDERLSELPRKVELKKNYSSADARVDSYEWLQYLQQGLKTLGANKIRTALSMLGILIGVASVVTMLAVGSGAKSAIQEQLASLGSNLLVLRAGALRIGGVSQDAGATMRLTSGDAWDLKEKIPFVNAISPTVTRRAQASFKNKNWNTQVMGTTASYAPMHASDPEIGRFFTDVEDRKRSRVAVIGVTLVRKLFADRNPIGEYVKINKMQFQVIGVLPEKGANAFRDQDDIIIIPLMTAIYRFVGHDFLDTIDLEVTEKERVSEVEQLVLKAMMARHRVPLSQQAEAFQIRNMSDVQDAMASTSNTMSTLLATIAAISLLVGGIGIMNIMLVSVTERTKEIGLRKAIGARRKDILLQFLAEALVVSAVGGIVGIALGCIITGMLSLVSGWATVITFSSIALAFFFSSIIGIVFGIYPARKASALHPIEALRFE